MCCCIPVQGTMCSNRINNTSIPAFQSVRSISYITLPNSNNQLIDVTHNSKLYIKFITDLILERELFNNPDYNINSDFLLDNFLIMALINDF